MQANKTGLFTRLAGYRLPVALALGFGVAGGGYVVNEKNQEANHNAQITALKEELNTKLDQSQSDFTARLNISAEEKDKAIQALKEELLLAQKNETANKALIEDLNRKLQEYSNIVKDDLGVLRVEVDSKTSGISGRLSNAEAGINQVNGELGTVKKTLDTKEEKGKLVKAIESVKPSAVMITSNGGKSKWSGFILDVEGVKFLITCAHSYEDIHDFVLRDINVEGEDYKFDLSPQPFDDNKVAFFPFREGSDLAVIPLPKEAVDKLPKSAGIKFRDFVKNPLKHGEDVFNIGNPLGLDFTVKSGKIIHPGREMSLNRGPNIKFIQVHPAPNKGDSGGVLCDADGNAVGIMSWTIAGEEVFVPVGHALSGENIKDILADKCGLKVRSKEEIAKVEIEKALSAPLADPFVLVGMEKPKSLPDFKEVRKEALAKKMSPILKGLIELAGRELFSKPKKDVAPPPPSIADTEGPELLPPPLIIPPPPEP